MQHKAMKAYANYYFNQSKELCHLKVFLFQTLNVIRSLIVVTADFHLIKIVAINYFLNIFNVNVLFLSDYILAF